MLAAALAVLTACGRFGEPAPVAPAGDDQIAQTAAMARAAARAAGGTPEPTPPGRPAAAPPAPSATPTPRLPPTPVPTRPIVTASPTPAIAFPSGKPITYAAIGASDTVGVGAPNPARDGWVPQLHRRLPAGSRLVSLGVSGAKLSEAVQGQLPRAIEARPDLVTVWNVVNDLNANVDIVQYERDLDRLLRELSTKTTAHILVANCPDLSRVPAYAKMGVPADELRREVARWNEAIARSAQKYPGRVHLVDLYARSGEVEIDATMVSGDDFHPSAKGYGQLAAIFWEFMVANRLVPAA